MFYLKYYKRKIYDLLGVGFLIFIHELGHFVFCKLFKIPAPKFAIGIGPKLFSKKYKGTEYSLGMIPISGYVQIGEEKENESDSHILYKHSWIEGTLTTFGGIIFNLFFAYIAITSIIILNSQYILKTNLKSFIPQKSIILEDKEKNQIILKYYSVIDMLQNIKKNEFMLEDIDGAYIVFENEKFFNENFTIKYTNVTIPEHMIKQIFFAIHMTNNIIKQSIYSIINLFKGGNISNLSGPIGIIKSLGSAAQQGYTEFFIFLALISISLAVINLVPIPMLDGGQFLLLSIYKIFGRGVPDTLQTILTYLSLGLIILMTLFSTYNDIIKVFFLEGDLNSHVALKCFIMSFCST